MVVEKLETTLRAEALLTEDPRPLAVQRQLADEGIHLSLTHIYVIKHRLPGHRLVNVDASEYLPWKLRREDYNKTDAQRLRDLARRHANMPLPERRSKFLDNWLKALTDSGMVVDYKPDNCKLCEGRCRSRAKPGSEARERHVRKPFVRVPRRKPLDKWGEEKWIDPPWIRDPRLNDDGSAIDWTDTPEV